jgi:hypothetical protein
MRPYYHSFNSKVAVTPANNAKLASFDTPVYDSTYSYTWDTIAMAWEVKGKNIHKSYDSNKNLVCVIGKLLVDGKWENSFKTNYTYNSKNAVTGKFFYTWQGSWLKFRTELFAYNAHNDLTSYAVTQLSGSTWVNIEKNVHTYDNNNNKLTESYMTGVGSTWVNNYQYLYSYDATGNRVSETYQLGSDSTWRNTAKWCYTYDANHNRLSEKYMNWQNSAGAYVNAAMYLYTYDENNNLLTQVSQNWENEEWTNSVRNTHTYDDKNNKTKEFVERWNGTNWENRLQYIFTFDQKDNNINSLTQEFISDKWVNVSNLKCTYDALKNKTGSVEQEWKGEAWINREKFIYSYNSNGNLLLELNQRWDDTKNWYNAYYHLAVYDKNFILTDESHKSWNIVTDKEDNNSNYPPFITGDSMHYYIHKDIATTIADKEIAVDNPVVYPNPSVNGIFNIGFQNQQLVENLEVYDSTGKLILKQQQSNVVTIPDPVPGIYFIRLDHHSSHYTQRLVIQ